MDEARFAALEARVRNAEDQLEIIRLLSTYGPAADSGECEWAASLWTEDGVFDRGAEFPRQSGRAAIAGGSSNPEHRRAVEQGIAHFAGLPYVRVTGDTAFAITYLQILVPDRVGPVFEVPNHGSSRGFHVHRVSANRWEFVRTGEGWKIKSRRLRSLDGTEPARDILRSALNQ